jgi:hypothetical protein
LDQKVLCQLTATFAAVLTTFGILSSTLAATASVPLVIYVAPNGLDGNDGSVANAVSKGIGPLATLEGARNRVRALRLSGNTVRRPIEVLIEPGTYVLPRTFVLTAEDSGESDASITYSGIDRGKVLVTGGRPVTGWSADPEGGESSPLDFATYGRSCPEQLYIDGERRERPRLPTEGTFAVGAVEPLGRLDASVVADHFFDVRGDLPVDFQPDANTEVVIFDAWTVSRMRAVHYTPGSGRLDLSGTFIGHGGKRALTVGLPYYIENPPIDRLAPGTWRCDPITAKIHYRPRSGESFSTTSVVAPRLETLVAIRGSDRAPVHDLSFKNITFAYSAWILPQKGWAAMQAEVGLGAAIELQSCRSISLRDVAVVHTGAAGIGIRRDCSNVEVVNSRLDDIGGTGIAIGSAQRYPAPNSDWEGGTTAKGETFDIHIIGNDIGRLGRIQRAGVGVWSGQAYKVRIERNHIHDLYQTAISIGWVWNFGPTLSHDNAVLDNSIETFGQGMTSDFGGVYTLGRQDRTLVAGNTISRGVARIYGGYGLYADEGSAGITFRDNTIRGTSHAPIHVHFGTELTFKGNVSSDYGEAAIRCSQPSQGQSVLFEENLFNGPNVPETQKMCNDGSYAFEANVFRRSEHDEVVSKPFGSNSFFVEVLGQRVRMDKR